MSTLQKLILTCSFCTLAACTSLQPIAEQTSPLPEAAAQTGSDEMAALAGIYAGDLPCADCVGQRWHLVLNANQRYRLRLTYLDKGVEELTGFWRLGEGDKVYLNDDGVENFAFQAAEDQLSLLDRQGQPIVSQFNYTLTRQPDTPLQGMTWNLVRLVNQEGAPQTLPPKPAQLRLDTNGRFSGFGGCNRILGAYQMAEEVTDAELFFDQIASTKMACIGDAATLEDAFLKALAQVESWQIKGQTLYLLDSDGKVTLELEAAEPEP
ncbi:hypothetical protein AGMMS49545_05930 [Betaproteobacteria bacterium]|nr:hypothetical protein AGMMS49545_05930 [Betaproteobacteria bacterium]GHU44238.1 hypothetical protein AGMMS50289_12110 [Betaproteobacteria bacterium]